MLRRVRSTALVLTSLALVACASPNQAGEGISPRDISQDPDMAEVFEVDRFTDQAGTFFRRSENPNLPGPGEAIELDAPPFLFSAFGLEGNRHLMYSLDVRSPSPANLYVFFKPDGSPLTEQLYVFDALPGEAGYSDFCAIQRVTVPGDYVPNSVTSRRDLEARISEGFKIEPTGKILNMPVVPEGSTATKSTTGGSALLIKGWCRNKVLHYFAFDEVQASPQGLTPTATMYAFFSEPDLPRRGPFRTIDDEGNTRNVVSVVSGASYSPLWALMRLAKEDFINVNGLEDVKTRLSAPPVPYGATLNAVIVR